jgi:hypothetical protein
LEEIDKDLAVCFSPVHERWLLWFKNPRIGKSKDFPSFLRPGWQMLMMWETPKYPDGSGGEYLPLTELLFGNIYIISRGKIGGAKKYFDKILADVARRKESMNRSYENDRKAQQADFRSSLQINSAGRGNKFALHHDGGLIAGPGEQAWRNETRKHRLGSAVLKQESNEKEQQFYGK